MVPLSSGARGVSWHRKSVTLRRQIEACATEGGSVRYAIYFAPAPEEELARFGAAWLGRDAELGADIEQPRLDAVAPETLRSLTAAPRRYGFHATLKPPFALADGRYEADLVAAVGCFAAAQPVFDLPALRLAAIGRFLALIPAHPSAPLQALADNCVREFDGFRAPPTTAELARRKAAGLTARQEDMLRRWGYPYVFEEWRFHMTLTGRLSPEERAAVEPPLRSLVAPLLDRTHRVGQLAIFAEPQPGGPFIVRARFALGG